MLDFTKIKRQEKPRVKLRNIPEEYFSDTKANEKWLGHNERIAHTYTINR